MNLWKWWIDGWTECFESFRRLRIARRNFKTQHRKLIELRNETDRLRREVEVNLVQIIQGHKIYPQVKGHEEIP